MGRRVASWGVFGLVSLTASGTLAQTRTRREMNLGAGVARFPTPAVYHGDPTEYAFAFLGGGAIASGAFARRLARQEECTGVRGGRPGGASD